MPGMIKDVAKIVGILLVSLLLFSILFAQAGQGILWDAASSAVEDQWLRSTMNNGYSRTMLYETEFQQLRSAEFTY